jgi:hypothetical protein
MTQRDSGAPVSKMSLRGPRGRRRARGVSQLLRHSDDTSCAKASISARVRFSVTANTTSDPARTGRCGCRPSDPVERERNSRQESALEHRPRAWRSTSPVVGQRELVRERRVPGRREASRGQQPVAQVVGFAMHARAVAGKALTPDGAEVDRRRERTQRLVAADVARGLLAADVLLARRERQHERPVFPSRSTVRPTRRPGMWRMCSSPAREEPECRTAEAHRDAERLSLPDHDVGTSTPGASSTPRSSGFVATRAALPPREHGRGSPSGPRGCRTRSGCSRGTPRRHRLRVRRRSAPPSSIATVPPDPQPRKVTSNVPASA